MKKNLSFRRDKLLRIYHSYSAILKNNWILLFSVILLVAGCKKVTEEPGIVGVCPIVLSTDPSDKAVDVVMNKLVTATFNTEMNPESITGTTFVIKQGNQIIPGTVAATADKRVFTFKPDMALMPFVKYTGTIYKSVTDNFNTSMVSDYVWSFTTIPQISLIANTLKGGTVAFGTQPPATTAMGTFAQGSTITANAVPNAGYTFANWTDSGTAIVASTSPAYQFAVAGNRALIANFTLVPAEKFAVTLSSNPVAGGSTFGSGAYDAGTTVTVIETPNPGFTFKEWQEGGVTFSTNPSFQFVITSNRTFVAVYNTVPALQYALLLSSNPPAGGTTSITSASGNGPSFAAGTSVTANAFANPGYTFTNWTEGSNILSNSASYTFSLNATRSLVANFAINLYTLSATVSPLNSGTIVKSPDQPSYANGTVVLVTATPLPGYAFKEWQNGSGTTVSANAAYQVTMNANKVLVAMFTAGPAIISTDPADGAIDVAVTRMVTATFSEAMNPATINTTTFSLKHGATSVAGMVTYTGMKATFNPSANLLAATTYTATITKGAKNPAGLSIPEDSSWTFSTPGASGLIGPDLNSAGRFGILSGVGISNNAGPSVINNMDVGIYPGLRSSITGFLVVDGGPGLIVNGAFYAADDIAPPGVPAMLLQAKTDLTNAYLYAKNATLPAPTTVSGDQGGKTLAPGIYKSTSTLMVQNGDLTLDAKGNGNAVWIFQIASDFTTVGGAGGNILLTGGAKAANVYWQVGSSATIGSYTSFKGNIMALTSITMGSFSVAEGRMLAQNGAVVLTGTNTITKPN